MSGTSRFPEHDGGGYSTGYAVIAGGLCLSLAVTVPMAGAPLARGLVWLCMLLTGT